MSPNRIDPSRSCWPHKRWLAAAFCVGLVALALSACGKAPDQGDSRDGKGTAQKNEAKAKELAAKREAAEEKRQEAIQKSQNNLKQIMLALHSVHDTFKRLPPAAIYDKKTGKPLLSWRVTILPFIEQVNLYRQIKLDEPWDGPNNKKLLKTVVPVFAPPGAKDNEAYKTFYRIFAAAPGSKVHTPWLTKTTPNAPFGAWGERLHTISDGTSNTIGVVEAGEAVPWMKPDELEYDPKKPLPKLGGLLRDGFNAGLMDGSVYWFSNRLDESALRALITANGGEAVSVTNLEKKGLAKGPREFRQGGGEDKKADDGPSRQKEPADPRRRESANKLKEIILALHNFHDTYRKFPPAAICDKKTGKPLLSWRVAILPYLEQAQLYRQFKLDEPWDSPHNKELLGRIPAVYAPLTEKKNAQVETYYRGFIATPGSNIVTAWQTIPDKNSPFGAWGGKLFAIPDGTSNTIGLVEAGEPVPWTKPDELVYDAKKPLPKLGGLFKDGFNAGMMDGSVQFIPRNVPESALRALITANGGEVIPNLEAKNPPR